MAPPANRYADALARLYALESRGIRMGATRMEAALELRGHPECGQRFIHVAGTNGKGSVSAMIAACLSRAGYRTGLFTSPHMHRYVERVRIDGRPLRQREVAARIVELLAAFERPSAPQTTFFELTTLLALEAFRDHRCDIAVLEVGLGGRLDATNAVIPAVAVITSVALDHTQVLGTSIAQIAREKAGIIKPGVPVVVGSRDRQARAVIARRARSVGSPGLFIDRDFAVSAGSRASRFSVRVGDHVIEDVPLRLSGAHQRDNAACALTALLQLREAGFVVSERSMRAGLAHTDWPARLERVPGRPTFLFDAAHNVDGCHALARFLTDGDRWQPVAGARRVLVFGVMADKAYPAMLRILRPLVDRIFFCPPALRRAATHAQLRRHAPRGIATRNVADALQRARRAAGPDGQVVVAGSIFLVADARARILGLRSDPLIRF